MATAAHNEATNAQLLEAIDEQMRRLAEQTEALRPEASAAAADDVQRAVSSAEGRLQLEQERFRQQLRDLLEHRHRWPVAALRRSPSGCLPALRSQFPRFYRKRA